MSAIITEKFRKNNTAAFIADLVAEDCYVGIGRSEPWPTIGVDGEGDIGYNVESPLGTVADMETVKNNLITLIGIPSSGGVSHVIPKVETKSSRKYKAYDPYSIDCFYQTLDGVVVRYPCYAVASDRVYLCLKESNNETAPYNFPTGSESTYYPFSLADGSVWTFVYAYTNTPSTPINATQFMSIGSAATPLGGEDAGDIEDATGSLVFGFSVVHGGSGFTTLPTVHYVTDAGAEIELDVEILDGAITSVSYDASYTNPNTWVHSNGYVRIVGGGGANARVYPRLAPAAGFGANPIEDLPTWYAGVTVQVEEDLADAVFIPYRQISLLRNPEAELGTVDPTISLSGLNSLEFDELDTITTAETGELITQASSGAIAIVDYLDSTNHLLYYHQNHDTGFVPFEISNDVVVGAESASPITIIPSEYITGTGEVLFVENRSKITRTGGQTEDISIILQF